MRFSPATTLLSLSLAHASPIDQRAAKCTPEKRIAAVKQEIKTITTHSLADAQAIPLTPLASRTFVVAPEELFGVAAPVNVGFTAGTVRLELVALGTALLARVPPESERYIVNANGSVTADFIQLNKIGVLPNVTVREVHEFDQSSCKIKSIIGFVFGKVTDLV